MAAKGLGTTPVLTSMVRITSHSKWNICVKEQEAQSRTDDKIPTKCFPLVSIVSVRIPDSSERGVEACLGMGDVLVVQGSSCLIMRECNFIGKFSYISFRDHLVYIYIVLLTIRFCHVVSDSVFRGTFDHKFAIAPTLLNLHEDSSISI